MRSLFGTAGMLVQIAFRNLFASRLKTLIVGGIVLFGSTLVVVGSSLLDTVDDGMRRSIQGSLAGQIQVYSSKSRDDLALYGGMQGDPDLEPIEDFSAVKKSLLTVPNVKAVIPMGIHTATVAAGNAFDVALEKLRESVRELKERGDSPELRTQLEAHKAHVRRMVKLLREELAAARELADEKAGDPRDWADLGRAASDEFWDRFDADPLASLELLENRVAPQSIDGGMVFLRYVGTDLQAFQQAFDRMEIVEGSAIPPGKRGILVGKFYAEERLKLKTAHRLDKIREALQFHKRIATDEELRQLVKENTEQTREILLQLDSRQEKEAVARLQKELGSTETDLQKLLVALLQTDDSNFERRYQAFYSQIAPFLQLYSVRVGETITLKGFTRSGYMKSVNVKVYGLCQFKGLERSGFAGVMSVMDLVTFRDLYGFMTAEKQREIAKLKEGAGARAIERENAEAELFGGERHMVADAKPTAFDESSLLTAGGTQAAKEKDLFNREYTTEEIESGVALNAAVVLKDPSRIPETLREIEAAAKRDGLALKAVSWQQASGIVGQFVSLSRLVLYVAVLIIFAVALVIINNAMVMATLQRVKEIGTMRAIGAQRRFILAMLLAEAVAVGLTFGAAGAGLGSALVWLIRASGGIRATNQHMYFFFSGPSLLPYLGSSSLVVAFVIVLLVSTLSGFYPALLAMRVAPVEAMQSDE